MHFGECEIQYNEVILRQPRVIFGDAEHDWVLHRAKLDVEFSGIEIGKRTAARTVRLCSTAPSSSRATVASASLRSGWRIGMRIIQSGFMVA